MSRRRAVGSEGPVCGKCDNDANHPRFLLPNHLPGLPGLCQVCGAPTAFVWGARRPYAEVTDLGYGGGR